MCVCLFSFPKSKRTGQKPEQGSEHEHGNLHFYFFLFFIPDHHHHHHYKLNINSPREREHRPIRIHLSHQIRRLLRIARCKSLFPFPVSRFLNPSLVTQTSLIFFIFLFPSPFLLLFPFFFSKIKKEREEEKNSAS